MNFQSIQYITMHLKGLNKNWLYCLNLLHSSLRISNIRINRPISAVMLLVLVLHLIQKFISFDKIHYMSVKHIVKPILFYHQ